jgi:FkbM family methyltransferase
MISYSQSHEDVRLRRAFPDAGGGFYVDVGANDPLTGSVTKHFYDRGWRGVNVEPIPGLLDRLRVERPRDLNLGVGLSDRPGRLPFFESSTVPGWSTFSPGVAHAYRARGLELLERTVPVTTLALLCEEHADRPIDFLKVDVEGHEREVLVGADWGRWRPRVVVVENAWPERWEPLLLNADYQLAAADPLNRYYVRGEDRQLAPVLAEPIGPVDDFIPYWYVRAFREAEGVLNRCEGFGPNALKVACWLHGLARRFPRLASAYRRALRPAG